MDEQIRARPKRGLALNPDALIMVIDSSDERGAKLKELIEFMDVPQVKVANIDNWRERLGERRLAAIFLGNDLEAEAFDRIVREVGEHDPNTAIVRVGRDGELTGAEQETED